MCIRSVYYCQDCRKAFPIPFKQVTDSALWKRIFCIDLSKYRQSLKDWQCDNHLCLRRTESGYHLCLNMHDNCYFCIRDNNLYECYNQYVYVPCQECYYKKWMHSYNYEPYSFPRHYRELNK